MLARRFMLTLGATLITFGAQAQDNYPVKTITLVVPVNAGGVTDQMARAFATSMARSLGQSVVVDNKGGANGVIGANIVAKAAPDGYTLCFCYSGPVTLAKVSMASLPYDIDKAFAPITRVYDMNPIIAVPANAPVSTLADLLKASKATPGMSFGHTGVGGALHLGMELLNEQAAVRMTAVAYPGENPMVPDLVTGRLNAGLLSPLFAKAQAAGGRVKLLASLGSPSAVPGVPTVADSGFPGFHASTWSGIFAPAGTPAPIIQKLYGAIQAAAADAEVKEKLATAGLAPVVGHTPEQFSTFVEQEKQKWALVVTKIGGIKN